MAIPVLVDAVVATPKPVFTRNGWVRALHIYNPAVAASYVQFFDAVSVADISVGTTLPVWSVGCNTLATIDLTDLQLQFTKGCYVVATTTSTGNTPAATGVNVNVAYE